MPLADEKIRPRKIVGQPFADTENGEASAVGQNSCPHRAQKASVYTA